MSNGKSVSDSYLAVPAPRISPSFEETAAIAEMKKRVLCPPPETPETPKSDAPPAPVESIAKERNQLNREILALEARLAGLRAGRKE
jgi:hypothetical protein